MNPEGIARALGGHRAGYEWVARCPAHDDTNPSFSITERDGRLLVKCHKGCEQEAVIKALKALSLWPSSIGKAIPASRPGAVSAASSAAETAPEWRPIVPVPAGVEGKFPPHRLGKPQHWWVYKDVEGRRLMVVARFEHIENGETTKDLLPLTYCEGTGGRQEWRWQGLPAPRPLYGLNRLAARPDARVLVVEGEKAADAAGAFFLDMAVITSAGGSAAADKAEWPPLKGRHVNIWPDNDEPGRKYAQDVARLAHEAGAAEIRIVQIPRSFPDKWDLADPLPENITNDDLRQMLEAALAWQPSEPSAIDDEAEIARLAKLPQLEYDRVRNDEAKRLGCRVTILDRLVASAGGEATAPGQGRPLVLKEPEPWAEQVNGPALLDEIAAAVNRYMVLELGAAECIALWSVHAHALDAFGISPRLGATSPCAGCGKTTLLDIISHLVPRPLATANISVAAIYRTIEEAHPTLLVDEADTFLVGDDEMRGVLNSGHRRGGSVVRIVGEDQNPRQFTTWGACAVAMIGKLPGTLADRSIPIALKRKRPDETVEQFRFDRTEELDNLARKAARWAKDNLARLRGMDPLVPPSLGNRQADNWRVLLAIAEAAGGAWPRRAREVAAATVDVDQARHTVLLADIRDVFAAKGLDQILSADLVAALVEIEGHDWAEYRNGRPLTANTLARLLAADGIRPCNIRVRHDVSKGYRLGQFADAFERYLPNPPNQTATPLQMAENLASPGFFNPLQAKRCSGLQSAGNPQDSAVCSGVAVANALSWESEL